MKSPTTIAAQIAKLLAEAKKLGRKRLAVIKSIVKQMNAHDISINELRQAMGKKSKTGRAKKSATEKPRKSAPVKYKDGEGNTWSGRGRAPRWLVAAEKSGKKREDFAV
jgi:DNA-binding protein H-NS